MARSIVVLIICAMSLMSCGMSEDEIWTKSNMGKDKSNPKERLQYCRMLVDKYPKSPHAPDALWRAAKICSDELRDYGTATQFYKEYFTMFPDLPDAPKALFLTAFIYNNELHNIDSARVYYTEFEQKYPGNELASSARFELENLGKETTELIPAPSKPQIAKRKR